MILLKVLLTTFSIAAPWSLRMTMAWNKIQILKMFLEKHPTCRIYCRDRSCLTLDSKAYGRGGHDSFVALNESESGSLVIGRILLFFENGDENFIYLQLFHKHKVLFLTDEECWAFGYEIAPTDRKKVFALNSFEHRLIRFDFNSTLYLLPEVKQFEHD